ncbi:hypothetical protein MXE01_15645, partial [Legionella pneumophila]|nr:hypothetical protein [Legionella pneumophila]
KILKRLAEMQYTRTNLSLERGQFRVHGDVIDIFPADSEKEAVKIKMYENLLVGCHEEWKEILMKALNTMDSDYLKQIQEDSHWLPGLNQL